LQSFLADRGYSHRVNPVNTLVCAISGSFWDYQHSAKVPFFAK
jgi:hypothetical protein